MLSGGNLVDFLNCKLVTKEKDSEISTPKGWCRTSKAPFVKAIKCNQTSGPPLQ